MAVSFKEFTTSFQRPAWNTIPKLNTFNEAVVVMMVVVLTQVTEMIKEGAQEKHGRTGKIVWLKSSD